MIIKKVLLAGSAVLALLIIAAGVLFASEYRSEPTYAARIESAQKYFSHGKYNKAILEYKAAIKLDAEREEAYLGLSQVYLSQGFVLLAGEELQRGMLMTGNSESIRVQLERYFPELLPKTELQETQQTKQTEAGSFAVNEELLRFLATACYSDYENKYNDVRAVTSANRCTLRIASIDADIIFRNTDSLRILNASTGYPYGEFLPTEIVFDNITVPLGGVSSITLENLRNLDTVSQLQREGNTITFELFGCKFTISCDEDGTISAYAHNRIEPTGTVTYSGSHTLTGKVIDATSGKPVSDAELLVYTGYDTFGDHASATTDYNGNYRVNLESSGTYSVVVSKIGYIEETFQVYITGAGNEVRKDFTVSPELGDGEIRIVLTWGSLPTDIDSHLNGTASDGTRVSVNFTNQTVYNQTGCIVAELDVDDVTGYGPETTTISDTGGSYYFDVVDFTRTTGVGTSDAVVKIYRGNMLLHTVRPTASIGLGWRVCRIHNGEIEILNKQINTSGGWSLL